MKEFEPSFKDFQRDIERYLISIGKREVQKDGMIVFHGYDEALGKMFRWYVENNANAPLVKEFRRWNWEYQYNDYLRDLTIALKVQGDWPNLQVLWEKGVLRSRKKLFNDMWKIEKNTPGTIDPKSFSEAKMRLLETLGDMADIARMHGSNEDVDNYAKIEKRINEGKRA